ncbi:MAG: NAD-dependent malic enzyme [Clostridiales bacterium]|jgi:malate dehydrogenase (oxaloacetate-decarboxylating)|nr:NAD-dependent malic enzyme [Clostridiales bacterium]
MDYGKEALAKHKEWAGKIEVVSRVPVGNREDLSVAYTPGVAEPCLAIEKNVDLSYTYTRRGNLVAVITDGTAVLGLGDIGPEAGMPVMEGKCALFKEFANVDAFPLCVRSKNVDEIVAVCKLIAGSFGGINLEDIASPRCFEIERRLKAELDIPVFHDDQHGTAVVSLAALINAAKLAGKTLGELNVAVSGAGASAVAVSKLLLKAGVSDVILCDRSGAVCKGKDGMNSVKTEMAEITNKHGRKGALADVIKDADVFFGLSGPGVLTAEMVKTMGAKPIIFAMANPVPEILPEEAKAAGAFIVGTGRSDYPNQINNVLAFPGIFRGAFDVRASDINDEMKLAAARALAGLIEDGELSEDYVIPAPFDKRVASAVAESVKKAAIATKVNRI